MRLAETLFYASIIVSVIGSNITGEFQILHSPSSLKFYGTSPTLESLLKEIISAALGLSADENIQWKGLYVMNPFNTPEAVVDVFIDGASNLGNHQDLISFPLAIDEYEPNIFEAVKLRIKRTYESSGNILMDIKVYDPKELSTKHFVNVFGEFHVPKISGNQTLVHLNDSLEVDRAFLTEREVLSFIAKQIWAGVVQPDNLIDFYNIRVHSLHTLSDFHGPNSAQMIEAFKLLDDAVQELCRAFVKAYDGSVLVTTIMINVPHPRRAIRSPDISRWPRDDAEEPHEDPDPEPEPEPKPEEENPDGGTGPQPEAESEPEPDPNFPIMFNIMLWFGVGYFFTLVAVVFFMMDMDPGRDSVVYRMSNIRPKKEM